MMEFIPIGSGEFMLKKEERGKKRLLIQFYAYFTLIASTPPNFTPS